MLNRRTFLKKTAAGLLLFGATGLDNEVWAAGGQYTKITILHTNDVHSRIEPFPMDGGKYQGLGGVAKRASLVKKIRATETNVLFFDCGDILQGTPYFNFYDGSLEFKLMNELEYDAATIGNHDFDAGIEKLAEHIDSANFTMLNANYDVRNTPLNKKLESFKIFEKSGVKVGVMGIGIELDGLVPSTLFGETQYQDPLKSANETAAILKNDHQCQIVVCLSHLGYQHDSDQISDVLVAKNSKNIDLILGGHTHTFLPEPVVYQNLEGKEVIVNQVGWAGIQLGRLDYYIKKGKDKKKVEAQSIEII